MKFKDWHSWGIRPRLVLIAMLPVVFMFFSTIFYSYHSRLAEVEQELEDRGRVLSTSLATSSEYGVISGNSSELVQTLNGLLQVDKSIYQIQIFDLNKKPVAEVVNKQLQGDSRNRTFEATIHKTPIEADMFDDGPAPYVAGTEDKWRKAAQETSLGYVKVVLSPSLLLEKKREQILIGVLIATTALAISIVLGLYLALTLTKPLSSTISALRGIRGGNHDIRMEVSTGGEIGELQATIIDMNDNLKQFTENLEGKVIARTRDLEEASNQAVKAHAENRRLIQKVQSAVEEERENIAVEIHDHLNASLIVAKLSAQNIVDMIKKGPVALKPEEIKARAQAIIDLTAEIYQMARGIVKRLRPEIIDTLGLRDAVEEIVTHYDNLHSDCRFDFAATGDFSTVPGELAISAYRLIQEALTNIVKHADATHASVEMRIQAQNLEIKVSDNGRGFSLDAIEFGIGLIGMRERAYRWGGTLEISSAPGMGAAIKAQFNFGN